MSTQGSPKERLREAGKELKNAADTLVNGINQITAPNFRPQPSYGSSEDIKGRSMEAIQKLRDAIDNVERIVR